MRHQRLVLILMALLLPALAFGQTSYPRGRRATGDRSTATTGAHKDLAGTFHGTLKDLTSKEIVIENDEKQTVSIRRNRKTKFLKDDREIKASEIALDTSVTIEASEDIDLKPMALTMTVDSPAKKSAGK